MLRILELIYNVNFERLSVTFMHPVAISAEFSFSACSNDYKVEIKTKLAIISIIVIKYVY